MTGVGEERRVQEATAAGVEYVLNKPFSMDDVLRLLHRVLSGSTHAATAAATTDD